MFPEPRVFDETGPATAYIEDDPPERPQVPTLGCPHRTDGISGSDRLLIAAPGLEEAADAVLNWAKKHHRTA